MSSMETNRKDILLEESANNFDAVVGLTGVDEETSPHVLKFVGVKKNITKHN